MMCFAFLSLLTGLVFWNLDEGVDGTRNRINVLFLHTMFLLLMVWGECEWRVPWEGEPRLARAHAGGRRSHHTAARPLDPHPPPHPTPQPFIYMSMYAQDRRSCVADFSAKLYRWAPRRRSRHRVPAN
jgi:hypothetical protein